MAISVAPAAFESELQHPEMVERLYGLLNLTLKEATFARVASILQSSGWGKSRAICELHRHGVWVVYCTFAQGSGYPRRSAMSDWLLARANALVTADTQGQLACMAFFLAYMEACLEELLSIASSTSPRDFVRMLYKSGDRHGCEEGLEFWHKVQNRVDALLQTYAAQGLDKSTGQTRQACWTDWEVRAAKRVSTVNSVVGRLRKLFQKQQHHQVKVLFVFDEARFLVPEAFEKNLVLPLRRATSAFNPSAGILALFADTTSSIIANFSAPVSLHASDRMPGTGLMLAPPVWACFGADYGLDDEEWEKLSAEHEIPVEYAAEYQCVRYGRPLWWETFKAGLVHGAEASLDNVLCLAQDKLLGGHGGLATYVMSATPVALPREAALAVLASRCALDMDPHCSLVSELVASHLMTVAKVSESRECIWAGFSMEPIVAAAASEIMRELEHQKRSEELYSPLCVALKAGWVHKEYKGELLTRLIMLWAFDKAVHRKKRSWCTVDELVSALVGKSLSQLGREQEETAAVNGSLFTEELKQVAQTRLCFQAFCKIGKKSCDVTAADLKMVADRDCALVADEDTRGIDHIYVDKSGKVVMHQRVKAKEADYGLADMAKESPAFCGLPDTGPYLDLHINVENVGGAKVTLVDPRRVECAVLEQKGKAKVLTAVLESQAELEPEPAAGHKRAADAPWMKQRRKSPRLFKAWQDWLGMPRSNQVILKVSGLKAVKPLLGDVLFQQLAQALEHGPLLDPAKGFQAMQAESVSKMFLRKL